MSGNIFSSTSFTSSTSSILSTPSIIPHPQLSPPPSDNNYSLSSSLSTAVTAPQDAENTSTFSELISVNPSSNVPSILDPNSDQARFPEYYNQLNQSPTTNSTSHSLMPPTHPLVNNLLSANAEAIAATEIPVIPNPPSATQYIQTQLPMFYQEESTTIDPESESAHITTINRARNLKENIPFGDNMQIKDKQTTRFYFQNIRGARKLGTWNDWNVSMEYLNRHEVDIIGFAETNINWQENHLNSAQYNTLCHYNKSNISTSSSLDIPASYHQPGGTSTIITNNHVGRIVSSISDDTGLGRWSGFKLRKKDNKHVYIITAYCPHIDYKYGYDTCYQQQWRLLRNLDHTKPEPRKQMLYDLKNLILAIVDKHDDVILQWDANNNLESNELHEFMSEIHLYNIMPENHDEFSTCLRGSRIIDHIWATESIARNVSKSGFTAFHENAWFTDHRALIFDINTKALFDSDLALLPTIIPRLLQANNLKKVNAFLNSLEKLLPIDDLLIQCQELISTTEWTSTQTILFEAIDTQLTTAMLKAEQVLKSNNNLPWSPELHQAYLIYTYWRKYMSGKRNRINIDAQLLDLSTKLGDEIYFGVRFRHPCQQLRKALRAYQKCQVQATSLRETHLQLRQEILSESKQFDRAKAVLQLKNKERTNRMFKKLKKLNKPDLGNGGL